MPNDGSGRLQRPTALTKHKRERTILSDALEGLVAAKAAGRQTTVTAGGSGSSPRPAATLHHRPSPPPSPLGSSGRSSKSNSKRKSDGTGASSGGASAQATAAAASAQAPAAPAIRAVEETTVYGGGGDAGGSGSSSPRLSLSDSPGGSSPATSPTSNGWGPGGGGGGFASSSYPFKQHGAGGGGGAVIEACEDDAPPPPPPPPPSSASNLAPEVIEAFLRQQHQPAPSVPLQPHLSPPEVHHQSPQQHGSVSPPTAAAQQQQQHKPPPHPLLARKTAAPAGGWQGSSGGSAAAVAGEVSGGGEGVGGEPLPRPTHQRRVSFGLDGTKPPSVLRATTIPAGDVEGATHSSQQSSGSLSGAGRHFRHPSSISIRSLSQQCPVESEAERHIQTSLDDLDPTRPGRSDAQRTLLGDVPEDASPEAFEKEGLEGADLVGEQGGSGGSSALPIFKAEPKKEKNDAQVLFELTKDLRKLQRQASQRQLSSTSLSYSDDGGGSDTNAGAFAKNAAKLVQRHKATIVEDARDDNSSVEGSSDDGSSPGSDGPADPSKPPTRPPGNSVCLKKKMKPSAKVKAQYRDFEDWLQIKKMSAWTYVKVVLFFVILPATGLAAILFYLAGNPPCGNGICRPKLKTNSTLVQTVVSASASWWILFIFVRQVVTFSLSRVTMSFLVDFLALRTKFMVRMFGPLFTLVIVQSKGWPVTLFFWGVYDFALLYGRHKFAKHWLSWQQVIGLMNDSNPAGNVLQSGYYMNLLIIAIVVSFVVAIKRCWVGLSLGRQTYIRYGSDLARVMKKAVLIGQVASLARDIEVSEVNLGDFGFNVNTSNVDTAYSRYDEDSTAEGISHAEPADEIAAKSGILDGVDLSSRRVRINQLLGEWEEPEEHRKVVSTVPRRVFNGPPSWITLFSGSRNRKSLTLDISIMSKEKVSIGAIIQFRQSLSCLGSSVPFSAAFGSTTTRQECVACSEAMYNRLLRGTPGATVVSFDVIALLAIRKDGSLDEEKLRSLIKLFRPDRDGNLNLLDFAKSVDAVYKELRLLRASVSNSSKLDRAFESMFNVFFYLVVLFIVVAAIGLDPLVLFGSVSGFVLGFAFMIGSACSKYVEGLLLIFVRRPYDIGDRIHVSNPNDERPFTGSAGWIVKDVDLYSTTVIFGSTNEVATYSNGSLASSRIINAARSPQATLLFYLKFPIDTPYDKLQVFKAALEKFIKARPREWTAFSAFRANRVEADLGFVEYVVIAQHRESWQSIGALLGSKAELSSFALELSKKMKMRYRSPPMPIDLTMKEGYMVPSSFLQQHPPGGDSSSQPQQQGAGVPRPDSINVRGQSGGSAFSGGGEQRERERGFTLDYNDVAKMFDAA